MERWTEGRLALVGDAAFCPSLLAGEGGMAHNLDHIGPASKLPWTRLEAPELTQELRDRMVDGCEREAGTRDIATLARERDAKLVAIARALKGAAASALEDAGEVVEIVDHAPVAAARFDAVLPVFETVEVLARVDVVAVQLGDVERHHIVAVEHQRDVADVSLLEILGEVREDEDDLLGGLLLVEVLDRLQDAARDIGMGRGLTLSMKLLM